LVRVLYVKWLSRKLLKTVVCRHVGGWTRPSRLLFEGASYRVIGLFMKTGKRKTTPAPAPRPKTMKTSREFVSDSTFLLLRQLRQRILGQCFCSLLERVQAGFTPNPDILCNREIKFKVFFDKAMEMGADFSCNRHYCQNVLAHESDGGEHRLVKGVDPGKDQTYFLYTMKKEILSRVLFPVAQFINRSTRDC